MRKKDMEAAFKLMGVEVVKGDNWKFITVKFLDSEKVGYLRASEHRTNQVLFDGVIRLMDLYKELI